MALPKISGTSPTTRPTQPARSPAPAEQNVAITPPKPTLDLSHGKLAASVTPVEIPALEEKFGWKAGGWQDTLLRSADAAAPGALRGDGQVTAAELDRYLANPYDLKFLTSSAMVRMETDLANAGGSMAVRGFHSKWEDDLSKRVDQSALGNHDGLLSQAELVAYFGAVKGGEDGTLPLWMPDQKQAAFDSGVADVTHEKSSLTPAGTPVNGTSLLHEYMRIMEDDQKRVPQWVSYVLSSADIHETPADVARTDNFHKDPDYPNSPVSSDYIGGGYDRGHQKPAEDSPNQEAMDESFLMTNMAPQTGVLNQQVWRTLEAATHDLVAESGGKATILTGSLFLDDKGQPLPPEKTQWIGKDGEKTVAVPTHFFKTVLLQLPNGHMTMYSYLLPNRADLPDHKPDIQKLLQSSRTSVDNLEKLLGYDLYANLPKTTQAQLESQDSPNILEAAGGQFHAASVLWPQGAPPPPLATRDA